VCMYAVPCIGQAQGASPLYLACAVECIPAMDLLLGHGADVNQLTVSRVLA
jgi:hypothetical protein